MFWPHSQFETDKNKMNGNSNVYGAYMREDGVQKLCFICVQHIVDLPTFKMFSRKDESVVFMIMLIEGIQPSSNMMWADAISEFDFEGQFDILSIILLRTQGSGITTRGSTPIPPEWPALEADVLQITPWPGRLLSNHKHQLILSPLTGLLV